LTRDPRSAGRPSRGARDSVDDVESTLDQASEVGQHHLGLLALGTHGPDIGQATVPHAVEVVAGQDAVEIRPGGWSSRLIVLPRPGDGAVPARRCVAMRPPSPMMAEAGDGPNERLSVLNWRESPSTSRVPRPESTDRTRLIRMRSGRRAVTERNHLPGSGSEGRAPGNPQHERRRSPGQEGGEPSRSRPPPRGGNGLVAGRGPAAPATVTTNHSRGPHRPAVRVDGSHQARRAGADGIPGSGPGEPGKVRREGHRNQSAPVRGPGRTPSSRTPRFPEKESCACGLVDQTARHHRPSGCPRAAHAHCDLPCGVYDPAQAASRPSRSRAPSPKYNDSDDESFKTRAIIIKEARPTCQAAPVGAVDRLLQARAPREVPQPARSVLEGHQEGRRRSRRANDVRRGRRPAGPDRRDRPDLLETKK